MAKLIDMQLLGKLSFYSILIMMVFSILDYITMKILSYIICDKYDFLLRKNGYDLPIRAIAYISYRQERTADYCSFIISDVRNNKTFVEKLDDIVSKISNNLREKKGLPIKNPIKKAAVYFNYKEYTNKKEVIYCSISLTVRYIMYLSLWFSIFFGIIPYNFG
ncbi:MAG: hypothetical protein CMF49_09505 [Legionellales bacterium]|nr:hypothetical protein [Legionellales bacterium]